MVTDQNERKKAKGSHDLNGELTKVAPRSRTPQEQRAEIERVAREHGADLSEEGFNEALRKVGKQKSE